LTFALSGTPAAAAKAPSRASQVQPKGHARPAIVAHAAGHKIA
jgi:hypothetical protein